ncbi:MAG TPA: hybrid sensor histidine kinase/response regulator [Candidatus Limnocylindria bacterium]|nr:hybrid sensor histidine kinase/response regulator [Candidatus Limnocylindria bacterium]
MSDTTVLVVDDEESVATTIEAILRLDGHQVTAVTSGAEALRLLNDRQFDVVLTDLRLADVDGIEVLKEVQRTAPETAAIMLTGYASLESAVAALRTGAYDYLMKPSDVEELRATVNRAIERRELRKKVIELEEVDRLKTQFLSMASHELRTPLTAVSGFIQVARRRVARAAEQGDPGIDWKQEATRAAETLELAQRQARRLGRLVDELLDVSRLQLGRVELQQREIDLVASVREVVERLRLLNTTHTFEFGADHESAPVIADLDRIDQVFENLLGNAVKYSPNGGAVVIGLRVDGDQAHVTVRDQGIGIAADEIDNIFNLFYRSPDPRAGHVGGLGLGLYISREIVTQHGGKLWAESPGDGSTFHVTLPLAVAAAPEAAATARGGATRG